MAKSGTRNPRPSDERSNTSSRVQSGNFNSMNPGGDVGYTQHGGLQYDRRGFTTGKPIQGTPKGNDGTVGMPGSRSPMVNKSARDR